MKVLIAEDDGVSRLMLRRSVEQLGHECLVAHDGEAAWELFRQHEVDTVVTDWMMPGLDGVELCRRIRAHDRELYTYVILLTALDGKEYLLAGLGAGADDYLTKPLDRDELRARLQGAARVTSLQRQLAEKSAELERVNHALAESARRDPLTGLGNRLQLHDDLFRLQRWFERYGRGYGVALCDVDRFKRYNDTYGHLAGDEALRAIGRAIDDSTRDGDLTYRFGGEEILVILPEQSAKRSAIAMERARGAVERLGIPHVGNEPHGSVTISVGVAAQAPGERVPWEQLLGQADAALYRAKQGGRNRVAVFDAPLDRERAAAEYRQRDPVPSGAAGPDRPAVEEVGGAGPSDGRPSDGTRSDGKPVGRAWLAIG
jgi:two-component system, cell cycle response regulator